MSSFIYLTIDDIPQQVTPDIVGYLFKKNIPAVMFAVGENLEKYMDIAVQAVESGILIGNHSYSHPAFEDMTYEEGVEEIEKTERLIEEVYRRAGRDRPVKVFRFPYLNKGGGNKELFQIYLKEHGFSKIDDSMIDSKGYKAAGWDKDIDVTCSFDIQEYNIPPGTLTFEDVVKRLLEGDPGMGTNIFNKNEYNIVLLHSHDDTERIVPGYYKRLIDMMLEQNVEVMKPEWIKFS